MNPSATRDLFRRVRTIFLDRDGVLNEKAAEAEYVSRWEDFRILPGVPAALSALNRAGLRVIVVSNQRGIARGLYSLADVEGLHTGFQQLLRKHDAHIDAFFICPHEIGMCNCRKPLTGLFDEAAARFPEITAESSVMIGDTISDIEFGRRVGMATIFVGGDPGRGRPDPLKCGADLEFSSLPEAVSALLQARSAPGAAPEKSRE